MKIAIATALACYSMVVSPAIARSQTVLEEIAETGVLEVGIRQNAIPLSYRDGLGNLRGYCIDLVNLMQERLTDMLDRPAEVGIRIHRSTPTNRFDLVQAGTVHIECGPNSQRLEAEGVVFSDPFFVTGIQFLIREDDRDRFAEETDLGGWLVGVLENTETAIFIEENYPNAEIYKFQGTTGRSRGVDALITRVDAFADDGILLVGELIAGNRSLSEYDLVPLRPLTCEYYGLLLPAGDREWQEFTNSILASPEADRVWQNWFGADFPYLDRDETECGPIEER